MISFTLNIYFTKPETLFKVIHLQNINHPIKCPSTPSKATARSPYHLTPSLTKSNPTQSRPVSTISPPTQTSTTVFHSTSLQLPSTIIKKPILSTHFLQTRNFSKKSRWKSFRKWVWKRMISTRMKFYECSEKSKTECKTTRNKAKSESRIPQPTPNTPKTKNQPHTTRPQKSSPHQARICMPIAEDSQHNNHCHSFPRPHRSRTLNPSHNGPGPIFRYWALMHWESSWFSTRFNTDRQFMTRTGKRKGTKWRRPFLSSCVLGLKKWGKSQRASWTLKKQKYSKR
jgi:hypothetical protein